MSSPPVVPPRPSRSQAASPLESSTQAPSTPVVPPRPSRSKSPMPTQKSAEASATGDAPSVRFQSTDDDGNSPGQTKVIPADLELKQPEPVPAGRENERQSRHSMHYMTSRDEQDNPPEIGQRIPLYPNAGDVQAPSPMPGSRARSRSRPKTKKIPVPEGHSDEIIVGDYGAYPSEQHVHRFGGTYSHSAEDLNQSVMQAIKGAGVATTPGLEGIPDEEVGYLASEQYASRLNSPMNTDGTLGGQKPTTPHVTSPLAKQAYPFDSSEPVDKRKSRDSGDIYIHHSRRQSADPQHSSTNLSLKSNENHSEYQHERQEGTPILASDELNKSTHFLPAAITPRVRTPEPRGASALNSPAIQPPTAEDDEDVDEEDLSDTNKAPKQHQPLFPESPVEEKKPQIPRRPKHREGREGKFPSKDIWEDAPDSHKVMYEMKDTPEESTQDAGDDEWIEEQTSKVHKDKVTTEGQVKAENKDTAAPSTSPPAASGPPPLPSHRPAPKKPTDEATEPLSTSPEKKSILPSGPKPAIPARPVRRKESGDEPSSAGSDVKSPPPPVTKPKPNIPLKVGGGIAALRANFMNDLNSRLKLGPQAPKKDEPAEEKEDASKEKEVLSDARKGRARGPSRRKPTPSAVQTEAAAATASSPTASPSKITAIFTVWSISEEGELSCKEAFMTEAASEESGPTRKDSIPVEKVVAEHESEMPKQEVDTVKEVLEVKPTPAPQEETSSAVAEKVPPEATEKSEAEVIQPPIPIKADTETEAVTSAALGDNPKDVTSQIAESEAPKEEAAAAQTKPAEAEA